MLKIYFNEFLKIENIFKLIIFFILSFLCTFGIGYACIFMENESYTSISNVEILIQNLKIVSLVISIIMLIITSDVFAKEFEIGMMKIYLYTSKMRYQVFFGKILYLLTLSIGLSIVLFFQYLTTSFILNIEFEFVEYFYILLAYLSIGVGVIPFVLIVVILSIIIIDSSIVLVSSIFTYLFLWAIMNAQPNNLMNTAYFLKYYENIIFKATDNIFFVLVAFFIQSFLLTTIGTLIFNNKDVWR